MERLFLSIAILGIVSGSCPSGWDLVSNGQCRGFAGTVKEADNYLSSTAITKCREFQAQPVIIHTQEEQDYWTHTGKKSTTYHIPLGLVCNTGTKRWQWSDGSVVDYQPRNWNYNPLTDSCASGCCWYMNNDVWYKWCDTDVQSFDIYCVKQLPPQPIANDDGCDGFEDDKEDGVCYQIAVSAESWQDAQMTCQRFGADAASIHNEKENTFIRRLAVSRGAVNGIFLGATVSGKGNEFGWIDGSEWDYNNFVPGFPMNGMGECLVMNTEDTAGQWVNVDCSANLPFACARKQKFGLPVCSSGPWKEGQIIYSPGFPFSSSTPCEFILSVDAGKKVELEVLILEANSCCDHLVLYENYFGGTIIANISGELNGTKYTTSSSNFMRVAWQPNGGVNVRGMMVTFRGV